MAKKTNKKHSEHDAQPDCVKDENRPNQAASTEESTADQATDQETVNSAETDTSSEEQSETEKLQKDLHDLSEKHMRLMAEYDNFRRRSKQEKEELYNASLSDVVADWLPVIDNLERAIAASDQICGEDKAVQVQEGIELIYRQA
ncbi:MAG TPA: nucleotide exchange factor GrpE, partial [Clostridiaceae bacterium]|nr:nucleotide exchange factor GrpE [Clostridiaceae bacterium]